MISRKSCNTLKRALGGINRLKWFEDRFPDAPTQVDIGDKIHYIGEPREIKNIWFSKDRWLVSFEHLDGTYDLTRLLDRGKNEKSA